VEGLREDLEEFNPTVVRLYGDQHVNDMAAIFENMLVCKGYLGDVEEGMSALSPNIAAHEP